MKTKNTRYAIVIILIIAYQVSSAQTNTFPLTGNVGIGTLSPATSLQVIGTSRFGSASNYAQVDGNGNLSFNGSSAYKVGSNKYAFQFASIPNYGLFFNSTDRHYEFRNSLAAPVFYIHADSGQGIFTGGVSVGSSALPPSNGLYVSGKVGIGTSSPDVKLHVSGGSDVTLSGGGTIVAGQTTSENIAIDRDEIQARNNGTASTLHLNKQGGNINLVNNSLVVKDSTGFVGIGITSPQARLHVTGGTDITLGGGGTIVAGTFNGNNLAIDNNEIQARNNGTSATLSLNAEGGLVQIGGDLTVPGTIFIGNDASLEGGNFRIICDGSFVPNFDGGWGLGSSLARWQDVWATDGTINTSDERDKTNIKDLNYGLNEIMKLRSVRFNWKNKINNDDKLGLIAQDLQKVLPEVVRDYEYKTNEQTGKREKVPAAHFGVMYADIIPVLIRAIQEQEQKIEALEKNSGNGNITSDKSISHVKEQSIINIQLSNALLDQNIPNPVQNNTSIHYNIPEDAQKASLLISDMHGKIMRQISLKAGTGIVNIDASALSAGAYKYSLMLNGRTVETKQMIVAK